MKKPPNPNKTPFHDPKNAFCVILGGGGARGLAHLGAMNALLTSPIRVGRLVGVSMGALMAALCAVENDPENARARAIGFLQSRTGQKLRTMVMSNSGLSQQKPGLKFGAKLYRELKKKKALARAIRSQSLLPSTILREMIEALIPDIDIEDLPIPTQIATVDLRSGQRVVLESGSLRRAVRASMSIPGVFPAVHHDGMLLSDIGVYNSVPCDIPKGTGSVHHDHEQIIAIDVGQRSDVEAACDTALDCLLRFQSLAEQSIRRQSLALADWVVCPNLPKTEWFDFSNPDPIIDAGYEAASALLGKHPNGAIHPPIPGINLPRINPSDSLYG